MYGTEIIGNSMEDAIAYIDDPKHQDIKEVILNEIKVK